MSKDRFPSLRKILKAIGLPDEAIEDIVERILDWLSTKDQPAGTPTELPFKLRDDSLSNAEISFCQVLRSVVGDRAVVCPKVNLGDLFFVATGDRRQNRALANRVDRKHVDFLLCEPKTVRPILGIELDDRSHDRADRQARDQLVEAVFNAAGLPLLRFAVKSGYAPAEIESQVMPHFRHQMPAASSPSAPRSSRKCSFRVSAHPSEMRFGDDSAHRQIRGKCRRPVLGLLEFSPMPVRFA